MKFIKIVNLFLLIFLINICVYGEYAISFDNQNWNSNQIAPASFSIGNYTFSCNNKFYTNYGYNFDINSISLYYMFQNPGTDNITIITTDGKPTKLISLAAYQVSQTFNDSLVIEGWNGSILKYSHSFPADTSWSTLSLNYDNITKIVIKINSDNSGNLVDYNFDNITFQEAILPVELVTFKGISGENGINLEWQTATEVNNHGFEIERITNSSWVKIGFVEGKGNSNTKNNYSFNDKFPIGDTVHYRLKQIDNDGKFKYSNEIEVTSGQFPKEYYLSQNYPNPFNPGTVINFRTPKAGKVVLKIYDLLGKEVVTLVDGYKSPGSYSVTFNASAYSSGIYIYVLKSDGFTSIKKMTLLK